MTNLASENISLGAKATVASQSAFLAKGIGANKFWVDPDDDLIMEARCIEKKRISGFADEVMHSILVETR